MHELVSCTFYVAIQQKQNFETLLKQVYSITGLSVLEWLYLKKIVTPICFTFLKIYSALEQYPEAKAMTCQWHKQIESIDVIAKWAHNIKKDQTTGHS